MCYGYRQDNELVIYDETGKTARKVLARHHQPHPPHSPQLGNSPQLAWDVRARHTFFSLYVERLSQNCTHLGSLYARASTIGQLASSVDALSLALVAFQFESLELMRLANSRYVGAIRGVGQALRNVQTAVSDETLQSVMLLDLYEKITNRNSRNSYS